MLWIGLISGTSADAIDAALVDISDDGQTGGPSRIELVDYHERPVADEIRKRVHELASGRATLRELMQLDVALGHAFAAAALEVVAHAGVDPETIAGIASHGQTVAHYPEPDVRASLQIASPAVIHAETGWPVVADFRSGDLAVGGQGAPLTPFFHWLRFAAADEPRAVLNIGGFTNVSYLPSSDAASVVAFDPGPGNALLDRAARDATGGAERFDRNGARTARGRVVEQALEAWLADPYFAKPPPKSTGHEYFDATFFERARSDVARAGGSGDDLFATLAALTVESVARSAEQFFSAPARRWIVYGGGVHNPALMDLLAARLAPATVETSESHGVPSDALEAIAFAVLGWCSAAGRPSNLPAATGARSTVCLGSATPPSAFRD